MTRVASAVVLAVGVLAGALTAEAQPAARVPLVGWLSAYSPSDSRDQRLSEAFLQGLRELGYVEGQTVAVARRYAEGRVERLPTLAVELVRLNVDVLVVGGDAGVQAAKGATRAVPIVVGGTGDLVGAGHVQSLARPGGNITGLTFMSPDTAAKRLELLRETVPALSRVAVLWNSTNPVKVLDFKETEAAARTLGVQLQPLAARGLDELDGAFGAMTRARPGALLVLADNFMINHRRPIVDFATRHRVPSMFEDSDSVDAGGLMAYGPNHAVMYRRAAHYVVRILKGAKPADLPVEQPTEFELVVNLRSATALGVTIPPSVLVRATRVIK